MATYTIFYCYQDGRQVAEATVSEPDDKPVIQTAAILWDALNLAGFHMMTVRPIAKTYRDGE